jgi:hypothetical protein
MRSLMICSSHPIFFGYKIEKSGMGGECSVHGGFERCIQGFEFGKLRYLLYIVTLRWSGGCVLASSTRVRGFKPGRSRRIFQGEKIPSTLSFGREVKPAVPCHRFTACKRSLNVTWKSAFRQNPQLLFLAH